MKIIQIAFTLLFLSANLFISSAQEHAKFKGIPIDGPTNVFVQALKDQGYVLSDTSGNVTLLTGDFFGTPDAHIIVCSFKNNVWKVAVEFERIDTWAEVRDNYETLKEALKTKYGTEPQLDEHTPDSYPSPNDLRIERARWECAFNIPGGLAVLYIKNSFNSLSDYTISLEYYDMENTNRRKSAMLSDI